MSAKINVGQSIFERYTHFLDNCGDGDKETVQVYQALSPRQLSELQLIRELSVDLQKKKDEEIRIAAEAAEEAARLEEEKKKGIAEAVPAEVEEVQEGEAEATPQ